LIVAPITLNAPCCSLCAIATLSAEWGGEMFDHTVLESRVPLF
jgi:hypothetical protein